MVNTTIRLNLPRYYERHDPKSMFYDLENNRACFRALAVFGSAIWHHSGSCAVGAFLITVCWMLNILVWVYKKLMSKANATSAATGGTLSMPSSDSPPCWKKILTCNGCCSLSGRRRRTSNYPLFQKNVAALGADFLEFPVDVACARSC